MFYFITARNITIPYCANIWQQSEKLPFNRKKLIRLWVGHLSQLAGLEESGASTATTNNAEQVGCAINLRPEACSSEPGYCWEGTRAKHKLWVEEELHMNLK